MAFIMIPGAQISGERYEDLAKEIQRQLPGARLWVGLTKGWLGNFPNPVEIAGAVNDCLQQGAEAGLYGKVFLAGHSLGGIMLETWIGDNPEKAEGIILLGSYLPDLFGDHSNTFPVPVLTAVGELDGMTLSYVYREYLESKDAEESLGAPGRYPVVVIEDANHAQVASGEIPDFVLESDIPSPISFEEAHSRYAAAVTTFITLALPNWFTEEETAMAQLVQDNLRVFTEEFLEPFAATHLMETDPSLDPQTSANFMLEGQRVILGASSEELASLSVINYVVPFEDLGDAKPGVDSSSSCQATVSTYSQAQYETSLADADTLNSASVIKAKFKLEDVVREALCLPAAERKQCKDVNMAAFDIAFQLATEEARERYLELGTQLFFDDDSVSPWGPGWEFSSGLHYSHFNATHTKLYSTSLISEPDFFIQAAAGMHYCDLLSPYRALEWIYITSLQGKGL